MAALMKRFAKTALTAKAAGFGSAAVKTDSKPKAKSKMEVTAVQMKAVQGLRRGIRGDDSGSESGSAGAENSASSDEGDSSDGNASEEEELVSEFMNTGYGRKVFGPIIHLGTNPTIASYNASVVKIYSATNNMARFKKN
jgi:hypothetical protein